MQIVIVADEQHVVLDVTNEQNDDKRSDVNEVTPAAKHVPVSQQIKEGDFCDMNSESVNTFVTELETIT